MTDMCEMRELADTELDVVCGGFLNFNNSFNTLLQGNLRLPWLSGAAVSSHNLGELLALSATSSQETRLRMTSHLRLLCQYV